MHFSTNAQPYLLGIRLRLIMKKHVVYIIRYGKPKMPNTAN